MKKCLNCKQEFTEKKVFGSCQDCKTCPNICDTCQIKVNDRQEEVKQKFQTDPDYAVKITAEFVKVEVSKEYPLLIKETWRGTNTGKEIEIYCYWKVVDGIKFLYLPPDKDLPKRNREIEATTQWIDFSHQKKSEFCDLRYLKKEKGKCYECEKKNEIVLVSFVKDKNHQPEKLCNSCLTELIPKLEKNAAEHSTDRLGQEYHKLITVVKEIQKILIE